MKRLLVLAFALVAGPALAAGGTKAPYNFEPDLGNQASLQRGARNYMNYCVGCHSLQYLRYNRMAKDLGIPEDILRQNLMFTSDKVGDTIKVAMPAESEQWFGRVPPDLTLETRVRGDDWVYSYLLTFYLDASRPTGVNNLMLPNLSMPHVLGELQGWQVLHKGEGTDAHGKPRFELVEPGALSPEEYKDFVRDLTNFMVYAAEPGRAGRVGTGMIVMGYLLFLLLPLAWFLKREYWKDVH